MNCCVSRREVLWASSFDRLYPWKVSCQDSFQYKVGHHCSGPLLWLALNCVPVATLSLFQELVDLLYRHRCK